MQTSCPWPLLWPGGLFTRAPARRGPRMHWSRAFQLFQARWKWFRGSLETGNQVGNPKRRDNSSGSPHVSDAILRWRYRGRRFVQAAPESSVPLDRLLGRAPSLHRLGSLAGRTKQLPNPVRRMKGPRLAQEIQTNGFWGCSHSAANYHVQIGDVGRWLNIDPPRQRNATNICLLAIPRSIS